MRTFVATANAGKLAELRAIFSDSCLELETYPGYVAVIEGERSYRENALLKARALFVQLRLEGIHACVLADDSGLEVEALGGRPGVLSARYAGAQASWSARRAALLHALRDEPDELRGARFIAHLALIFEDANEIFAVGSVAGAITREERGAQGFGYDPIFLYPRFNKTFAQLSAVEKNGCSHRFVAAQNLLHMLAARER